jgi:hypothetical protein
MAMQTVSVSIRVNHRRVAHIIERTKARLKRARKRDRPAMIDRVAREIADTCIRTSIGKTGDKTIDKSEDAR